MIAPEERLEFLRCIPIFTGLSDEGLAILAEHAQEISCPAGTLAVREGEPGNQLFIIYSGAVEVLKNFEEKGEMIIARLAARTFFGEMSIIECVARSASVRATQDTLLFAIKSMELYHLFRYHPDQYSIVILNIARDMSRRIRKLDEFWARLPH